MKANNVSWYVSDTNDPKEDFGSSRIFNASEHVSFFSISHTICIFQIFEEKWGIQDYTKQVVSSQGEFIFKRTWFGILANFSILE